MNRFFLTLTFLFLAMIDTATPRPLEQAIASLSARTPIGSALKSADWERVPLALRETAQFSAGVESARFLQTVQDKVLQVVKLERTKLADGREGAFYDRSKFIADLRKVAKEEGLTPYDPMDRGTLKDPTSEGRLAMIYDIQTQRAAEFARWKMEQDEDVLDAFPAQELIRVEERVDKRDWLKRWKDAGGKLVQGRMIARKDSPIWKKLSRFGTPWPPFDFGSGMGLQDVDRADAEELGVIAPDEFVEPQDLDFAQELKASARGLSDRMKGALETIFEDQIDVAGDEIRWNHDTAYEAARTRDRESARRIAGRAQEALRGARLEYDGDAEGAGLQTDDAAEIALAESVERAQGAQIAAVAIGRKPLFHEQMLTPDLAESQAAKLQGRMGPGVETQAIDGHLYVYRPDTLPVSVEEAHQLSLDGENGELLGYGQRSMMAPNSVNVAIKNQAGEIVGGFRAPRATARKWARRRANDYAIAWNEPVTVEVGR